MVRKYQNNTKINQNSIAGDYFSLSILAIVVMIIVWATLNTPEARQRETSKYCYYRCLAETDSKMTGVFSSGPKYSTILKECYQKCTAQENKEKDEKNSSENTCD